MIIIENGEVVYIGDRYMETCKSCGAIGYGNMTCSACVAQWPRFDIPQDIVDRLLQIISDNPPRPPVGAIIQ